MSNSHKKEWDEVEREQIGDWKKKVKQEAATNPLSKVLQEFVDAGAVIPTLDGRHR